MDDEVIRVASPEPIWYRIVNHDLDERTDWMPYEGLVTVRSSSCRLTIEYARGDKPPDS